MKRLFSLLSVCAVLAGTYFVMADDNPAEENKPVVTAPSKKPITSESSPREQRAAKRPKVIWAKSFLWCKAPKIEVESWYCNEPKPGYEKKYILLEIWATWNPGCRRTLPMLNHWQEKFGDELQIIAICQTGAKEIDNLTGDVKGKDLKFAVGIDPQNRTSKALGVIGIPHAVIIEPKYGGVIWEGSPNQPGHELTDETIEKILAVGRKQRAKQASEPESK